MPEPISTRGQHLPQLLQSRSSFSVNDSPGLRRSSMRPSNVAGNDDSDLERATSHQSARVSGDGRGIDLDYGGFDPPAPPPSFPLGRESRRSSMFDRRPSYQYQPTSLMTPQMRSQRLIGNSNPRYKWEQYFKSEDELKPMKKPIRKYYERNNYLIQQYLYIDRLLDSSLPHTLIQDYNNQPGIDIPSTIHEESRSSSTSFSPNSHPNNTTSSLDSAQFQPSSYSTISPKETGYFAGSTPTNNPRLKRTPHNLYKVPEEDTPLLSQTQHQNNHTSTSPNNNSPPTISPGPPSALPAFCPDDDDNDPSSTSRSVTIAIYLNLFANLALLILKIAATVLTSSLSVLASLVDAALDFLSTAIVWTTTHLISSSSSDTYTYPVGRRRLEPLGVLVFSVIMITSFFQVALEALNRLTAAPSPESRKIVQLSPTAIAIMAATVAVKALCYLYCRLIRNSSVQALAQDALTDIVFNTFSIIFPLVGFYAKLWFLDPLGGLLLALYVITSWSLTTRTHILHLTGLAASADERNILLYLTMRFAHTIKSIQGLAAYHAGDKLNVEVDIVLDEEMSLRDSHDLGESLQYMIESVPGVERAFVHADYWSGNLPGHMRQ